jgi:hypothetical protein
MVLASAAGVVTHQSAEVLEDMETLYRELKVIHRASNIQPLLDGGTVQMIDVRTGVVMAVVELDVDA